MPASAPFTGALPALRFALANSRDSAEKGRQQAIAFLAPFAISTRQINRIEVVFEELISNIVRYGMAGHDAGRIVVGVAIHPDEIEITFEDNGIPFNPLEKEGNAPFDTLENAKIGGLGIPLLKKFTKRVSYEYSTAQRQPPWDVQARDQGGLNRVVAFFPMA